MPVRRSDPDPGAGQLGRCTGELRPLAGVGDRFVFLVAFDHFSVTERKNPIGAIRAFQRAFAPGGGAGARRQVDERRQRWVHHEKVVAAAEGRPDIVFWDERLDREDQMALVAAADCLVSLHRSEGLGLHLAEAMWLGTPTIATRYSGNLDFMDDDCSMLVDATMVRVTDGQGIFPSSAMWADPTSIRPRRRCGRWSPTTRGAAIAAAALRADAPATDAGRDRPAHRRAAGTAPDRRRISPRPGEDQLSSGGDGG